MSQASILLQPQRWYKSMHSIPLALLIYTATSLRYLHHEVPLFSEREMHHPEGAATPDHASVFNDGLVWLTPKPDSARRVGWEDDWMMHWKERHYSPGLGCETTRDTPYDDRMLCHIPGYIPARLFEPSGWDEKPPIPRVIFVSWGERRLSRALYTSLLTLLHHNPDYEFILFDDEDVDRFVCENVGSSHADFAVPVFSKVRAGGMRTDVWRLLVMQKYGGVYVDSDMSALGRLPVGRGDTAVSGVGCWSHLPGRTGGLLEHWAMAFAPGHPFVDEAVAVMTRNLKRPRYLTKKNTPEAKEETSVTIRLTGPAMYQHTLHSILERAECRKEDNSYCGALHEPGKYCNETKFRSFFPAGLRLFRRVNFNNALSHKVLHYGGENYDDREFQLRGKADTSYCSADAFEERAESKARDWEKRIEENKKKKNTKI